MLGGNLGSLLFGDVSVMQNIAIFTAVKMMIFRVFSYLCSKHRLWVHGSNEYPQSKFKNENKKKTYILVNPSFNI